MSIRLTFFFALRDHRRRRPDVPRPHRSSERRRLPTLVADHPAARQPHQRIADAVPDLPVFFPDAEDRRSRRPLRHRRRAAVFVVAGHHLQPTVSRRPTLAR